MQALIMTKVAIEFSAMALYSIACKSKKAKNLRQNKLLDGHPRQSVTEPPGSCSLSDMHTLHNNLSIWYKLRCRSILMRSSGSAEIGNTRLQPILIENLQRI